MPLSDNAIFCAAASPPLSPPIGRAAYFNRPPRAKTRSRISRKDSPTPLPCRAKIKNRRGNFLLRKIPAFRARKKPAPSGQPAKKSRRLHCGGVFSERA
ncbi:MAG: hypothetical protein BHW65_01210 [Verrucomicrobia bacterium CAG:312_58_20]|nr:MAG: hypothetical protein BHW65_01210 [Verrucomicrobia bacterium CAG:312_58_20]